MRAAPLPRSFFARPAQAVARDLIGVRIVSEIDGRRVAGVIVEAEAYVGPHDPASHAAERIGKTARNASMFGPPGNAYVYRIYGHHCLNVVTDFDGYPGAVLLRAAAPAEGLEVMRERRWPDRADGRERDTARGPGNLSRALGVTLELDGHDLRREPLWLERAPTDRRVRVATGPRIGVTRARDWPLRFFAHGDPHVSARNRP